MDYSSLQNHVPDSIYNQIAGVLSYGIDGPLRLSHLLGQAKEECQNFTRFTENLNYSADALWSLFRSHFTDHDECVAYARQPEKIANRIYANRMGNGDEESGDGWLYRGRGCLQITGRSNYQALGTTLGIDLLSQPDVVATDYQLASAAWFFSTHLLWSICDHGVDVPTITTVTKHVNGGTLGLSTRIQYTQEIYQELTGTVV
jgi:putative chitinase